VLIIKTFCCLLTQIILKRVYAPFHPMKYNIIVDDIIL
jgi:hypothetical protein